MEQLEPQPQSEMERVFIYLFISNVFLIITFIKKLRMKKRI